jgi:hypothetical protein
MSKIAGPALALVALARAASAQPVPVGSPGAPPPEAAASSADVLAHFNNGNRLYDAADYAGALEEYRAALRGHRTAATMHAVAACLEQLARYVEALDQYDELREEFPKLSKSLEAKVAPAIEKLRSKVGTLVVQDDALSGALLVVDKIPRGPLPLAKPLRLSTGKHDVRVQKEGFDSIPGTVDVKPGQDNPAQLGAKPNVGRLTVKEKHGWVLRVEIDGKEVGPTPLLGYKIEPGDHRVRLSGFVGLDTLAECAAPDASAVTPASPGTTGVGARDRVKMESPAETATVRVYEETWKTLEAKDQDSSLVIASTPSGASVSIVCGDVRLNGETPWEGAVPLGDCTVEVAKKGFLPMTRPVQVERRKQVALPVMLEPDPAEQRRRARYAGAAAAYGVGALGLVVFAVTGALAIDKVSQLKSSNSGCMGTQCPLTQQGTVTAAQTLANVSTASLVVGGIGAATGTVVLLVLRPPTTGGGPGAGVGQIELLGRF